MIRSKAILKLNQIIQTLCGMPPLRRADFCVPNHFIFGIINLLRVHEKFEKEGWVSVREKKRKKIFFGAWDLG